MTERTTRASSYSATGDKLHTLKFVVTGSSGVGKTQLASRMVRREFREGSLPTVGMEFATRELQYAEHSCIRAQIWDTGGKVSFQSITKAFFRGAVGAFLVYDISRRSTFEDIVKWLALVRENCHRCTEIILIGNKSDMSAKQREVSMMEGMRFARKHGLSFFETSALCDQHVEEAFRQLVMSVARYLPQDVSVWSVNAVSKPAYVLPAGWVTVTVDASMEQRPISARSYDHQRLLQRSLMPPPPLPPQMPRRTTSTTSVPSERYRVASVAGTPEVRTVWFENAWNGKRVAEWPPYPAGPSDACLVSRVARPPDSCPRSVNPCPRPIDPCSRPVDPSKAESRKERDGAEGGDRGLRHIFGGMTSALSFSSLKATKGYAAAAAHCLSRCVDS